MKQNRSFKTNPQNQTIDDITNRRRSTMTKFTQTNKNIFDKGKEAGVEEGKRLALEEIQGMFGQGNPNGIPRSMPGGQGMGARLQEGQPMFYNGGEESSQYNPYGVNNQVYYDHQGAVDNALRTSTDANRVMNIFNNGKLFDFENPYVKRKFKANKNYMTAEEFGESLTFFREGGAYDLPMFEDAGESHWWEIGGISDEQRDRNRAWFGLDPYEGNTGKVQSKGTPVETPDYMRKILGASDAKDAVTGNTPVTDDNLVGGYKGYQYNPWTPPTPGKLPSEVGVPSPAETITAEQIAAEEAARKEVVVGQKKGTTTAPVTSATTTTSAKKVATDDTTDDTTEDTDIPNGNIDDEETDIVNSNGIGADYVPPFYIDRFKHKNTLFGSKFKGTVAETGQKLEYYKAWLASQGKTMSPEQEAGLTKQIVDDAANVNNTNVNNANVNTNVNNANVNTNQEDGAEQYNAYRDQYNISKAGHTKEGVMRNIQNPLGSKYFNETLDPQEAQEQDFDEPYRLPDGVIFEGGGEKDKRKAYGRKLTAADKQAIAEHNAMMANAEFADVDTNYNTNISPNERFQYPNLNGQLQKKVTNTNNATIASVPGFAYTTGLGMTLGSDFGKAFAKAQGSLALAGLKAKWEKETNPRMDKTHPDSYYETGGNNIDDAYNNGAGLDFNYMTGSVPTTRQGGIGDGVGYVNPYENMDSIPLYGDAGQTGFPAQQMSYQENDPEYEFDQGEYDTNREEYAKNKAAFEKALGNKNTIGKGKTKTTALNEGMGLRAGTQIARGFINNFFQPQPPDPKDYSASDFYASVEGNKGANPFNDPSGMTEAGKKGDNRGLGNVPVQFHGYSQTAFELGGQYELSEQEINDIYAAGGTVEFID